MDKYKEVVETLIRFRDERDWAQFHDSKNLALALLLEASELNELFLWKKESQADIPYRLAFLFVFGQGLAAPPVFTAFS